MNQVLIILGVAVALIILSTHFMAGMPPKTSASSKGRR